MRVLITGITGFVGSHLAEYLLSRGDVEVFGMIRWRSKLDNIEHIIDDIDLIECDIRDASSVRKAIWKIKPDRIFHLAAQSFVPTSWHAPAETLDTNIIGEVNLFEAVRDAKLDTRIQIAGSSEEYGLVDKDQLPIKETTLLRPLSPYGVSKVAQDLLGFQYYQSYGMYIVRTRAFNHTGPRRGEVFVESNFAKQLAEIEAGLREPVLEVGNLEAVRDFSDVRDIVRGYWLALEKGEPGEVYNICTGRGWKIETILQVLLGMSDAIVEVRQDPSRLRPSDVPLLIGSRDKFTIQTGWQPQIPLEKTLEDLFLYWREQVTKKQTDLTAKAS
jgi:GDP-4-dehydro-6-deoxy-D-mannose reductase